MKFVYITLGFLFLILGIVGIVIPVLPTTPFLLLASYFFAKGSDRMNTWFMSTKVYKNYIEDFILTRSMTLKRKLSILLPVSTLLILTFLLINNIYVRGFIVVVIFFKYYYFFKYIETTDLKSKEYVSMKSLYDQE